MESKLRAALRYIMSSKGKLVEIVILEDNKYKIGDTAIFDKNQFEDFIIEQERQNIIISCDGYNSHELYIKTKYKKDLTIQIFDFVLKEEINLEF